MAALAWKDVTKRPEFQSLSDEEKENARDQYFYEVVAPNAKSYDEIKTLRSQFDAETQPQEATAAQCNQARSPTGS